MVLETGGKPNCNKCCCAGNAPTSGSVMIDGVASTAALAGTPSVHQHKISASNKVWI